LRIAIYFSKIKDGLFFGDEETSMSEVFINENKISNLINLSGSFYFVANTKNNLNEIG